MGQRLQKELYHHQLLIEIPDSSRTSRITEDYELLEDEQRIRREAVSPLDSCVTA